MTPGFDPYGVEGRRQAVHAYIERYRKLRDAGRFDEAVEQLRIATMLANESVEHTIRTARHILSRIENLCGGGGEGESSQNSSSPDRPD